MCKNIHVLPGYTTQPVDQLAVWMPNPMGWLYNHMGPRCRVGLSPLHTKLKDGDKRNTWLHYWAAVRLSNRLSRCSTAEGTQHVLRWYAVDSAPNTPLTSSSLRTVKKDLRLYICRRCYTTGHYETTQQDLLQNISSKNI